MLVVAHHFVQSPAFWLKTQEVMESGSLPGNIILHSVFPAVDAKTGTCIWEAENVSDVQQWLDQTFGDTVRNVCYEVNEKAGMNLPKKQMAEAVA